jgi:carboxymethylenebutenolidase
MGEMVAFSADGEKAEGYLASAQGHEGRGVVVVQEWWGLNGHIKAVADRYASEGFVAMAPDLYHGEVTSSPDEAGKLLMALDIERAESDLRGAVATLKGQTGGPVGCVGFCMGGALSLFAACRNGEDIGACIVYYGGHPKIRFDFDGLSAPVLGHWAENDAFANATRDRIAPALDALGKPYEFHTYAGTSHAFFNDDRPEVYDRGAAELSFSRTLEFLRKHL